MASPLIGAIAVASKDLRSEFRTRFGLTALGLFVLTTVSLVVFAVADEPLQRPLAAAILWVIMFYTAMTGLARAFVSEEERGTALFLRLNSAPLAVYLGKLLVNVVFGVVSNLAATLLLLFFMSSIDVGNWGPCSVPCSSAVSAWQRSSASCRPLLPKPARGIHSCRCCRSHCWYRWSCRA